MIRKSQWNAGVSCLIALVAVSVLACPPAHAQVKPFKITGSGVGPNGLPLPGQPARFHWAVGEATHLGQYYGEGYVQTFTAAPQPDPPPRITGTFGSGNGKPFVFTGANGDQLVCYYGRQDKGASHDGTFTLAILDVLVNGDLVVEALWIAEFVPVSDQSTGKFAGVTGSWVMYAQSEPFVLGSNEPVAYSWEGQGTLTFKKGK
jgi:hypothetical protein